jgi:Beta-lactamase
MKTCLTLCLFIFSSSILFSQNENIEKFGEGFIKAINSNDTTFQEKTINEIFSQSAIEEVGIERLLNFIERMHSDYSPLEYHHSEVLSFDKPKGKSFIMHIYAKKTGAVMWSDFQMRLDSESPHKLKTIAFIAEVSEPVTLPNGSIEQKYTIDWLTNYLENLKSKYDLYGSILISKGKKVLFEKYYGFEDLLRKQPVTDKTLFNVASGGKMFTALCIARLVEVNKLNYEDKITKYLHGFSDQTRADKITIHNLLSHTSGVAEYWTEQTDNAVRSAASINDHLQLVYKAGFDFDACTEYLYCNSNYILLGAIIEKVTGKSFLNPQVWYHQVILNMELKILQQF